MTSALGFKARVDFSLAHFLVCTLYLIFTFGVRTFGGQHASQSHSPHAFSRSRMPGFERKISHMVHACDKNVSLRNLPYCLILEILTVFFKVLVCLISLKYNVKVSFSNLLPLLCNYNPDYIKFYDSKPVRDEILRS